MIFHFGIYSSVGGILPKKYKHVEYRLLGSSISKEQTQYAYHIIYYEKKDFYEKEDIDVLLSILNCVLQKDTPTDFDSLENATFLIHHRNYTNINDRIGNYTHHKIKLTYSKIENCLEVYEFKKYPVSFLGYSQPVINLIDKIKMPPCYSIEEKCYKR